MWRDSLADPATDHRGTAQLESLHCCVCSAFPHRSATIPATARESQVPPGGGYSVHVLCMKCV